VPNGTGADKINADAAATTSRAGGDAEQQLATRKAEEARKKAEADLPPDPALGVTPGSGQSFRDVLANGMPCPICPDMVVVPSGSFTMGAPAGELGRRDNEGPSRQVSIPRPFAIGKFSVTRGEFAAFVNDSGYKLEGGCDTLSGLDWKLEPERSWRSPGFAQDDRHPVVCLSWNDAKIFAAMLAEKTGRSYRLLSEAEWEFAARAGTSTRYFFGDDDKEFCRYGNGADLELKKNNPAYGPVLSCSDGYPFTAPVGSFLANAFGLYDMHGNAWQWVEDCYHDSYAGAPSDGSVWKAGGCARRPIRGGSWASFPRTLRAASRFGNAVDQRRDQWGFRVGRSLTP
jgi:formylglycine-generating enzyme required for sulfatase activity